MILTQVAERLDDDSQELLRSSRDLDEVVEVCTRSLRPHALIVHDRGSQLSTSLRRRSLASMSINRLRYGTAVTVAPAGPEEDTFLLTLPLAGSGRLRYGAAEAIAVPDQLYVVGPYQPFTFDFDTNYDQIVVSLSRTRVEQVAANMAGTDPKSVDLPLLLGKPSKTFVGLLEGALALAEAPQQTAEGRLAAHIEEALIESLLLPFHGLLFADAHDEAASSRARLVDRAQEYMREHLADSLSLTSVAARAGVSLRSLQLAFRSELGTTPGTWLREERLDRAYRMLASAQPGAATVTSVAVQQGFVHLGEFAAQFRSRFGESPSEVLRRR